MKSGTLGHEEIQESSQTARRAVIQTGEGDGGIEGDGLDDKPRKRRKRQSGSGMSGQESGGDAAADGAADREQVFSGSEEKATSARNKGKGLTEESAGDGETESVDELLKGMQETITGQSDLGTRRKRQKRTSSSSAAATEIGAREGGSGSGNVDVAVEGSGKGVPASSCDSFGSSERKPHDPWVSLKLTLPPAQCKVQGFPIEELDPRYNFRRGFALGFTDDSEDRTHLLPYLRASQDLSLHARSRRILIDLGAGSFDDSLSWFLRYYPMDFTEVHAFEQKKGVFALPRRSRARELLQVSGGVTADEDKEGDVGLEEEMGRRRRRRRRAKGEGGSNEVSDGAKDGVVEDSRSGEVGERGKRKRSKSDRESRVGHGREDSGDEDLPGKESGRRSRAVADDDGEKGAAELPKPLDAWSRSREVEAGPWPVPQWQLDRIQLHENIVAEFDGTREVNITRWLLEELKLTPEDAVVVKMDIAGAEWDILPVWLQVPQMPFIVDDFFVKLHYHHPSMKAFKWERYPKRRSRATRMISLLRTKGFYTHYWP